MPLTFSESLRNLGEALERGVKGEEIIQLGSDLRKAQWRERREMQESETKSRKDKLNALTHAMHIA